MADNSPNSNSSFFETLNRIPSISIYPYGRIHDAGNRCVTEYKLLDSDSSYVIGFITAEETNQNIFLLDATGKKIGEGTGGLFPDDLRESSSITRGNFAINTMADSQPCVTATMSDTEIQYEIEVEQSRIPVSYTSVEILGFAARVLYQEPGGSRNIFGLSAFKDDAICCLFNTNSKYLRIYEKVLLLMYTFRAYYLVFQAYRFPMPNIYPHISVCDKYSSLRDLHVLTNIILWPACTLDTDLKMCIYILDSATQKIVLVSEYLPRTRQIFLKNVYGETLFRFEWYRENRQVTTVVMTNSGLHIGTFHNFKNGRGPRSNKSAPIPIMDSSGMQPKIFSAVPYESEFYSSIFAEYFKIKSYNFKIMSTKGDGRLLARIFIQNYLPRMSIAVPDVVPGNHKLLLISLACSLAVHRYRLPMRLLPEMHNVFSGINMTTIPSNPQFGHDEERSQNSL